MDDRKVLITMSYCVYLTHPDVIIDPAVPVPDWPLSVSGRECAARALTQDWASDIRHLISSDERKAIDTAEIIAQPLGLGVTVGKNLHENDRSATGYLPRAEFEAVADQFFANPDKSVRGWERATDAQIRIVTAIKTAISEIQKQVPVLFTGHGGVGTLLICHLLSIPISRDHDQNGGGHFILFPKAALTTGFSGTLAWQGL